MRNLLEYPGSLISEGSLIVAPYDLGKKNYNNPSKLRSELIKNFNIKRFSNDYKGLSQLNIINGMGVTLGDSIIGIAVLSAIKKSNPNIKIKVIRPETVPLYVESIYNLASSVIDEIAYMPFDINELKKSNLRGDLNIDVGNQLYSPDFHLMEMHDYFIMSLGVDINSIDVNELSNKWLRQLELDAPLFDNYTLFAPLASTKIRSIPSVFYYDIVDMLSEREGRKVLGFVDVNHKNYVNISRFSPKTKDFLSFIKYSSYVYTCDSSALHIAAGFGVPTECIFNTILPELRVKYYRNCKAVYAGDEKIEKIQASDDEDLIKIVEDKFRGLFYG